MPRSLRAISVALTVAAAAPPAALANPARDFAGSHTPARVEQRVGSGSVRAASFGASLIGPDVSHWNGCAIDWAAVAQVRAFSFAKATEGSAFTDPCFAANWWQMTYDGVARGAYHFARPRLPISSARAQARHYVAVVNSVGGFRGALPPVLDVEVKSRKLGRSGLRAWIRAWIREVRAETHRYKVTIYTGNWFWRPNVGSWAPRGALLWASGYSRRLPRVAGFRTPDWWQYTDGRKGPDPHSTPGIGASDSSVWLGSAPRLASLER
jgi:GH25 family lysozyme M1 (1,4-beta-N-acetylmuramidase)